MIIDYFPGKMFQTEKDGVCSVEPVHILGAAAAANTLIIAAVTGKRILVLGGVLRARTVQSDVAFFSAAAGTQIHTYTVPAVGSATPNVDILPQSWGAFVTLTSQGLYANFGAGDVDVSLMYITYTP